MNYQKTSKAQIAKNSLLLYFRTFITIFISIYTSRITLLKLGVDDYGIFSVVGGIAIIFTFLSSSFFSATQRYLTLSLVKDNIYEYKKVFTTTIQCYLFLSVIILFLGETIGLYLVNDTLNIVPEKMKAANYVYQCALVSLVFGLTNGSYKASIIAHEKYSYYAYSDVIVKLLRLLIVFALGISSDDKLITYAVLYMLVSVISFMMDLVYCKLNFFGCRYIKVWDKALFIELTKFSSISILKKFAETCCTQGNNILINIFGGVIASASFGLSNQVWGTLIGFFLNVQTGFSPQITKSYGASDYKRFETLILDSCKFSSFVVILLAVPLIVNMPTVLKIWLKDVPEYATPFCILTIFSAYITSLYNPLNTAIIATGKIKKYQIFTSFAYLLTLPIAFILLKSGSILAIVFIVRICCQIIEIIYSAHYLSHLTTFNVTKFINDSLKSTLILVIGIIVTAFIVHSFAINNIRTVIFSFLIGETICGIMMWYIGFSNQQRHSINLFVTSKLVSIKNRSKNRIR